MSSGLRLRRPVFLPPDSAVLSVFVASLFAPSFFPSSVFLLPARISHCPHFPLPVFLSARVSLSPQLPSFVGPSSFVCIPSGFSSVISCFSVHRPSPAACYPSPVVYPLLPVVHPLPFVVRRPLRRPSFIARRLLAVARTPYPAAPLSAAVRSGSRLLYPRNPGLRVCGSCLPCRSASGSVGRSFRKNASALRTLVAAPFLTK